MDAGVVQLAVIVERANLTVDELVQNVKDALSALPAHSVGVELKRVAVNGEHVEAAGEWEWLK